MAMLDKDRKKKEANKGIRGLMVAAFVWMVFVAITFRDDINKSITYILGIITFTIVAVQVVSTLYQDEGKIKLEVSEKQLEKLYYPLQIELSNPSDEGIKNIEIYSYLAANELKKCIKEYIAFRKASNKNDYQKNSYEYDVKQAIKDDIRQIEGYIEEYTLYNQ